MKNTDPLPPADPAELGSPERLAILLLLSRERLGLTTEQVEAQFAHHELHTTSALVGLLEDGRVTRHRDGSTWVWRVNVPSDHAALVAARAGMFGAQRRTSSH